MAKRLTYNDAVARWYDEHPELKALRGTWQAITCATCGYLDETMEPAFWKCSQCLHLVSQPGHLRPVVNLTAVEEDEAIADHFDRSDWPPERAPGTPPSAIRTNPQPQAPEPVTAPTAQPILDLRAEHLKRLAAVGAENFLKAPFEQPKPVGISCRVVTTKRK